MVATTAASSGGRHNNPRLSKRDLTRSESSLVELMQRINFGRIEQLPVKDGQPILAPKPQTVLDIKLKAKNGERPEFTSDDFDLKAEVVNLFRWFDELHDCVIKSLEIQYGLPFRMTVEDAV